MALRFGVQQAWNEFNMKSNKLLKMKQHLSAVMQWNNNLPPPLQSK